MPATSEIYDKGVHKEDAGYEKEEETRMMAAPEKKNFGGFSDERVYLDQIEHIMQHGHRKGDRTGTGVISVFGTQARYSLRGLLALTLHNCFTVNI